MTAIPSDPKVLEDIARRLIEDMNGKVSKAFTDSVLLVGEGMVHTTVYPTGCVAFKTIDKGVYMATSEELGMTVREYAIEYPTIPEAPDLTDSIYAALQMSMEAEIAQQLREQYEPELQEAIRLTARGNHGDHSG